MIDPQGLYHSIRAKRERSPENGMCVYPEDIIGKLVRVSQSPKRTQRRGGGKVTLNEGQAVKKGGEKRRCQDRRE